jgi:hypothetical protein
MLGLPFLNNLDGLKFLAEFANQPEVSEEEVIDAMLSLYERLYANDTVYIR